ncbi:calcium-regulated heat-stable protein 1-like [Babylonia areolata]|uniref:calcium-regulated heat-stable protein 1-like n=1 Tax=Babylonia areolata TaxID=304850 RepID=UPI003FD0E2E4
MASEQHVEQVPGSPPNRSNFLVPSPVPTRRNRTYSQSERALKAPLLKGIIKSFCRQKGHGFITHEDSTEPLFVHISDVDGEYVPLEGDEVTFRTISIPPRNEKKQACHVVITHLKPGVKHERWDSPASSSGSGDS